MKSSNFFPIYPLFVFLLSSIISCKPKTIASFKIINESDQLISFFIIQPFNRSNEKIDSIIHVLPHDKFKYSFPMADGLGEGEFKFGYFNYNKTDTIVRYFGYYNGNVFPYEYIEIIVDSSVNIFYH